MRRGTLVLLWCLLCAGCATTHAACTSLAKGQCDVSSTRFLTDSAVDLTDPQTGLALSFSSKPNEAGTAAAFKALGDVIGVLGHIVAAQAGPTPAPVPVPPAMLQAPEPRPSASLSKVPALLSKPPRPSPSVSPKANFAPGWHPGPGGWRRLLPGGGAMVVYERPDGERWRVPRDGWREWVEEGL